MAFSQEQLTFEDMAIECPQEWDCLDSAYRAVYRGGKAETYRNLISVEIY